NHALWDLGSAGAVEERGRMAVHRLGERRKLGTDVDEVEGGRGGFNGGHCVQTIFYHDWVDCGFEGSHDMMRRGSQRQNRPSCSSLPRVRATALRWVHLSKSQAAERGGCPCPSRAGRWLRG